MLALVAAKIFKTFAEEDEDYSEIHNKNAKYNVEKNIRKKDLFKKTIFI